MRKTKIICTLGPATDKGDVLRKLMQSGADVVRLNFSHQTHAEQKNPCRQGKSPSGRIGSSRGPVVGYQGP